MSAAAPREELNPFEIAKAQFDRAADYLELEESMRNVLRAAKRQLIVSIPVRMDGGETKYFCSSNCLNKFRQIRYSERNSKSV